MGKEDAWLKEILDGLGDLGPPWEALLAEIKDWPLFVGYTISAEKFRLETAVGDEFTKQGLSAPFAKKGCLAPAEKDG